MKIQRLSAFCFAVGLFLYTLYISNPLFVFIFGDIVFPRSIFSPLALSFILISAALSFLLEKNNDGLFEKGNRIWIVLLFLCIVSMSIVAAVKGNSPEYFFPDFEGTVLFFSGLFIGARNKNWEFIDTVYMWTLIWALVMGCILLADLSSMERSVTEASLLNKVQTLLYPAGFFIFTYKFRRKPVWKWVLLATFTFYFLEQIIFQKRLPFVRLVVIFALVIYVQDFIKSKNVGLKFVSSFKKIAFAGGMVLLGFFVFSLSNIDLSDSLHLFQERAQMKSGVYEAFYENRFVLAIVAVQATIEQDFFLGKGFGGLIYDKMFYWSIPVEGVWGSGATSQIEVGQVWPFWKGGIVFWLVFNGFLIKLITSRRRFGLNYFSLSCWAFVLVHFLFSFGELYWISPHQNYVILFGCVAGHLLSKYSAYENDLGGRLLL